LNSFSLEEKEATIFPYLCSRPLSSKERVRVRFLGEGIQV